MLFCGIYFAKCNYKKFIEHQVSFHPELSICDVAYQNYYFDAIFLFPKKQFFHTNFVIEPIYM